MIEMPDNWVSDELKEKLRAWCPIQPVLISAPTGRGKTSFVKEVAKFCRTKVPGKKGWFFAGFCDVLDCS